MNEANHDKTSYDHLMKHRPNPNCGKRLLAATVDRPVALGEDALSGFASSPRPMRANPNATTLRRRNVAALFIR
jgi:hypothetical protein